MKLRKIEREGEMTHVRLTLPEKLAKRVENYLLWYLEIYETSIDIREFGLLAIEAIVKDKEFLKWEKENLGEKKITKQAVNGKDEVRP